MSLFNDLPEPPHRIKKTQLALDEAIALTLSLILIACSPLLARNNISSLSVAALTSVAFLYSLKSLKPESILFIGFPILLLGVLAKLEHWWWSGYALILGTIIIIGSSIYIGLEVRKRRDQRFVILSLILILIALLFKLQHRPSASLLLLASIFLFTAAVSYRYYLKEDKNIYDLVKLLLLIITIATRAFNIWHYSFVTYLDALAYLTLLFFIIISFVDIFKNRIFTKS